jgi:cytosine deaminase
VQSRGVEVINFDNDDCKQLMDDFMKSKPELWNEDIGESFEEL